MAENQPSGSNDASMSMTVTPLHETEMLLQDQMPGQMQQSIRKHKGGRTSIKSRDWDSLESFTAASSETRAATTRSDVSSVSPAVAEVAMRRFVVHEVAREGFERAEHATLHRLVLEVTAFIEQVFARAKAYADVSNRARPVAADVLAAVKEYDLDVAALIKEQRLERKRRRITQESGDVEEPSLRLELVPPPPRNSSPELLPSDDEDMSSVPQTLRALAVHLPPLPPKHTYLRTPVPPPKRQALPSLEKKLENAALVQDSLRNLLLATEIDVDANDGDLFGGVVNWEATRYPRKKWKTGG